jgi:hypothetical protein
MPGGMDIKLHHGAGRLAFRHEGTMFNAYLAYTDRMENATFLGCISIAAVVDSESRKLVFMQLMMDFIADAIEETMLIRLTHTLATSRGR